MTFPFVVFCHYSEQFYVSQAEQFSDCLSGQKQIYEIVKVINSPSEIEELELTLSVANADTWSTIFNADTVTLVP